MYREYFGLKELPFSIAPDPRYLYMSERHKEALAHLLYGVSGQGGFVVLTGEVGTGKTTICRCFLQQVPTNTDVAFIVNPKLSAKELLGNICDEFGIAYPAMATIKVFNDLISRYLLKAHSEGRHTVLIIDEAQNLRIDVLEQLRLLTNLETSEKKLLQIILLGQPELQAMLARTELRQLAQRVTARYHLSPLSKDEVSAYIRYRLSVAGQKQQLFNPSSVNRIYKESGGIPRLINLVCDRALLGSYSQNDLQVTPAHVKNAFKEIQGDVLPVKNFGVPKWVFVGSGFGFLFAAVLVFVMTSIGLKQSPSASNDFSVSKTNSVADSENSGLSAHTGGEAGASDKERTTGPADGQISIPGENADNLSPCGYIGGAPCSPTSKSVDNQTVFKAPKGKTFVESLSLTVPPFNSKKAAYKAVLKVWGVDYSRDKGALICEFAETRGLRCLHKQGNLRSLMEINRPAVLKLINKQGQEFYAGLLEIQGANAHISLGTKTVWTSLSAIDQQWYGDYSVIWQLPPYKSRLVRPGELNDQDKWLSSNIRKFRDKSAESGLVLMGYNESMSIKDKVRWFQKEVGLAADGLAGTLTLIQLNNYVRPNRPLLVKKAAIEPLPKS